MKKGNDKIVYLRQWLSKTIVEHPEVIDPKNPKQTPAEVYAVLFTYWSKDIQEAMKSLLGEVKSIYEEETPKEKETRPSIMF